MERKEVKLELKEINDEGRFVGLAAVYGNRDLGGDVIMPGAFTKTITENGGKVPLLYGHKTNIGISTVQDSDEGLLTEGALNMEKQAARDVHSDLRFFKSHGLSFGMSIGYLSIPDKTEYKDDRFTGKSTRYLREVQLFEATLTEFPMNPKARVASFKDLAGIDEMAAIYEELKAGRTLSASTRARMEQLMDEHMGLIEKFRALMDSADSGKSHEPPTQSSEPAESHSALNSLIDVVESIRLSVPR